MAGKPRAGFLPLLLVGAASFLSFFWNIGSYGIFDLDEGLYVEAAREMNLSGDFVLPRVNGAPFYEKPPLVYWLSAAAQHLLGRNELAARLPAAISSALLSIAILFIGSRFFGAKSGLLAALAYALNPIVFGAGRQLTMDAVLALWIAAALFSFSIGYTSGGKGGGGWFYGFWVACALGVLSKGAPGIVIPLVVVILFLLIAEGLKEGIHRLFTGTRMLFGLPVFLAIIVPWHVAAWHLGGQPFFDEYIIRQHLGRFRGGDTAHRAPAWFYLPGFLIGFFPWSFFTVPALFGRSAAREGKSRNAGDHLRLLCKLWFAVVFVLFSASGSKLISYIMPLYAPAALLGADWAVRASFRKERSAYLWAIGLAALLAGLVFIAVLLREQIIAQIESATRRPVPMDQVAPGIISFVIILVSVSAAACLTGWILAVLRRPGPSLGILTAGMSAFIGVAVFLGLPAVDRAYLSSLHTMVKFAGTRADSTNNIVLVTNARRPSALFYLPDHLLPDSPPEPTSVFEMSGASAFRRDNPRMPSAPYIVIAPRDEAPALQRFGKVIGSNSGWTAIQVNN